jgi:hypothetical protein
MVYFQTKSLNLGNFLWAVKWKRLLCYLPIWNILPQFGTFYCHLFVQLQFGTFSPVLVYCVQKKSGIPGPYALYKLLLKLKPNFIRIKFLEPDDLGDGWLVPTHVRHFFLV